MSAKPFMTTVEVADELGVSDATVRRLIERGKITARPVSPALARPKALEIERASVEKYKQALRSE